MRKILLIILLILMNSCISENHYHDGNYVSEISFVKVEWKINGNEIQINNSLSGVSHIKCIQYDDRIEIEENNGIKRIFYLQKNGDLKMSDLIIFKKVDEIVNYPTDSKNNDNKFDLSKDVYTSESAIIKELKVVQNELYIVVDIVTIKDLEDSNFEIVNTNSKLRTYKVKMNVITTNSKCVTSNDKNYLMSNRNSILNESPFGFVIISTNNFGELTEINLGCWG